MGTVHLAGGEKGGIFKSGFTLCLAATLADLKGNDGFVVVECDRTQGDVAEKVKGKHPLFYAHFSEDERQHPKADPLIQLALEEKRPIVASLPAQSNIPMRAYFESGSIADEDVHFVYWHISNGSAHSFRLFRENLETFPFMSFVFVKNLFFLREEAQWKEAQKLTKVKIPSEVPVITLPSFPVPELLIVDSLKLTFMEAADKKNRAAREALNFGGQNRFYSSLKEAKSQIILASEMLATKKEKAKVGGGNDGTKR